MLCSVQPGDLTAAYCSTPTANGCCGEIKHGHFLITRGLFQPGDLAAADCTLEEYEEYEQHLLDGTIVFAGVDYARILAAAEKVMRCSNGMQWNVTMECEDPTTAGTPRRTQPAAYKHNRARNTGRRPSQEADVIIWDGGNNDLPFIQPSPGLHLTLVDPHRAGHERLFHPGEANLLAADVIVMPKVTGSGVFFHSIPLYPAVSCYIPAHIPAHIPV